MNKSHAESDKGPRDVSCQALRTDTEAAEVRDKKEKINEQNKEFKTGEKTELKTEKGVVSSSLSYKRDVEGHWLPCRVSGRGS